MPIRWLSLFLLATPQLAWAGPSLGASAPIRSGIDVREFARLFDGNEGPPRLGYVLPSLDVRVDELVFQIHALETVVSIGNTSNDIYFGGNGWGTLAAGTLGGQWEVFGGVGGSADLYIDDGDVALQFGPVAPIGVRYGTSPRVGVYVQPGLYLAVAGGVGELIADGDLLVSVWF